MANNVMLILGASKRPLYLKSEYPFRSIMGIGTFVNRVLSAKLIFVYIFLPPERALVILSKS